MFWRAVFIGSPFLWFLELFVDFFDEVAKVSGVFKAEFGGGELHLAGELADELGDLGFGDFFEIYAVGFGLFGGEGADTFVD